MKSSEELRKEYLEIKSAEEQIRKEKCRKIREYLLRDNIVKEKYVEGKTIKTMEKELEKIVGRDFINLNGILVYYFKEVIENSNGIEGEVYKEKWGDFLKANEKAFRGIGFYSLDGRIMLC